MQPEALPPCRSSLRLHVCYVRTELPGGKDGTLLLRVLVSCGLDVDQLQKRYLNFCRAAASEGAQYTLAPV